MTDPRNIAHDKRVQHKKKHQGIIQDTGAIRPGRKPHQHHEPKPEIEPTVFEQEETSSIADESMQKH